MRMPSTNDSADGVAIIRGLKWVAGVITAAVVVLSAATWAGDTRYITKSEFRTFSLAQEAIVIRATAALRKGLLEDKIFELDLVPDAQKTDVQRATANRAKTQLQDVQIQLIKEAGS